LLASQYVSNDSDEEEEFVLNLGLEFRVNNGFTRPFVVGGSRPGKAPNVDRDRHEMHDRMFKNYFSKSPIYEASLFRRRYRMRRSLFVFIMDKVCAYDSYFVQKRDALGFMGLYLY